MNRSSQPKIKEEIIKLRMEGKTYYEIADELKCAPSLINYHLFPNRALRERQNLRSAERRIFNVIKAKEFLGNKCCKCGYEKCKAALEFHHIDPNTKTGDKGISNEIRSHGFEAMKKEIMGCLLVCSNCHREIHDKIKNKARIKNIKSSSILTRLRTI